MHQRMLEREEEAVEKLHQVIAFATADDCKSYYSEVVSRSNMRSQWTLGLAQSLANYFGDTDAVPGGLCGECTYCKTAEAVKFNVQVTNTPEPNKIQAILRACPERDDPRLLARMAFGITSPRLTNGRWSTSNPYFGSMVDVDFGILVAAFDKECKKAGYAKSETAVATSVGKKRAQPSGRSSFGSAGGTSKRGKYYK